MTLPGNHIGTLIKAHSYLGEMILKGKSQFLNNLQPGNPLFVEIDGQGIPFYIEEISIDKKGERAIIKLEFIDSDIQARRYQACEVYLEGKAEALHESIHIKDYIGYTVRDLASKKKYLVTDYFDHPGNPILQLKLAKQEVLLPLNADYIGKLDAKNKVLEVTLPEGY